MPSGCIGQSFNCSSQVFAILMIWAIWYQYDSICTYQIYIYIGGKFEYLSKTGQRTVYLIISLPYLLKICSVTKLSDLQQKATFKCKQTWTVERPVQQATASSTFRLLRFCAFGDANFSGGRGRIDSDWSIFYCSITVRDLKRQDGAAKILKFSQPRFHLNGIFPADRLFLLKVPITTN